MLPKTKRDGRDNCQLAYLVYLPSAELNVHLFPGAFHSISFSSYIRKINRIDYAVMMMRKSNCNYEREQMLIILFSPK